MKDLKTSLVFFWVTPRIAILLSKRKGGLERQGRGLSLQMSILGHMGMPWRDAKKLLRNVQYLFMYSEKPELELLIWESSVHRKLLEIKTTYEVSEEIQKDQNGVQTVLGHTQVSRLGGRGELVKGTRRRNCRVRGARCYRS